MRCKNRIILLKSVAMAFNNLIAIWFRPFYKLKEQKKHSNNWFVALAICLHAINLQINDNAIYLLTFVDTHTHTYVYYFFCLSICLSIGLYYCIRISLGILCSMRKKWSTLLDLWTRIYESKCQPVLSYFNTV